MARFAAAGLTANTPTTARGPHLAATTAVRPVIREIGVTNTTTTAFYVAVARTTAIGTGGAALTEVGVDDDSHVAIAIATGVPTADHTISAPVRQAAIGAAIGAGVVFTFGGNGLVLDNVATAGATIFISSGTGQHFQYWIEWTE